MTLKEFNVILVRNLQKLQDKAVLKNVEQAAKLKANQQRINVMKKDLNIT